MGTLLKFSPRSPRPATVPAGREDRGAQLLMFTGVRYERTIAGAGPAPVPKTRRTRKG